MTDEQVTDEPKALDHAAFIAGNAILHASIQIIRAGTGKVENYQITGTPEKENLSSQLHIQQRFVTP